MLYCLLYSTLLYSARRHTHESESVERVDCRRVPRAQAAAHVQRVAEPGGRHPQAERAALGGRERQPVRRRAAARGARRLRAQERQGVTNSNASDCSLVRALSVQHAALHACTRMQRLIPPSDTARRCSGYVSDSQHSESTMRTIELSHAALSGLPTLPDCQHT